ncbi:uncharacterized protein LOC133123092 [Conger conger]|uniref:uncharacterized protein LOC133123092 n=1 Tax=Conger conger TaxID=82655 RepID=UPI002A59F77D|nr:uncharacterized protein LOC133123092 [Conger conger]
MEQATPSSAQDALQLQGQRLDQHESEIRSLHQSLHSLRAEVTGISDTLGRVKVAGTPVVAPTDASDHTLSLANHTLNATLVSRDPTDLSCPGVLRPSTFPTERSMAACVITLLAGKACERGTTFWDSDAPECGDFTLFSAETRKVFNRAAVGRASARRLLGPRQENSSISGCAIEFQTLAGDRVACSVVVEEHDWDPQGRRFDPRSSHSKIRTAVGPLSKALNPA